LLLLREGFFKHNSEMRRRLAAKAEDSKIVRRLLSVYREFGSEPFTWRDVQGLRGVINVDTLHRAVGRRILRAAGAQPARDGKVKWYRLYKFTEFGLASMRVILSPWSEHD